MIKVVIRKDVYDELIEKGYGKKDYGKLQKVQRPDYGNPSEEIENEKQKGTVNYDEIKK